MEDIRVLEQQQRDSQRLLTSIKLTKQHKLQEQSVLEINLSSLKYTNGEAQAQLLRCRDVLSKSTRDLGSSRLKSDRSSDNIKQLDDKMKRALATIRALHSKQRIVCASMRKLHNAEEKLNLSLTDLNTQMKAQELTRDDLKHRSNLLAKSIQSLKAEVKEFFECANQTRSEVSTFEKELTTSQQLEGTTKNRVESIESELTSEDKRHKAAKLVHDKKIKSSRKQINDTEAQIHHIGVDIEVQRRDLIEKGKICIQHQNAEGHEVSTHFEDAMLDISRVKIITAKTEELLRHSEREKRNFIEKVNILEQDYSELKQTYEETTERIKELEKVSSEYEWKEKERSIVFEDKILELKCQREKVAGLRNALKALQTTIRSGIECDEKDKLNQEFKIKEAEKEFKALATKIEGLNSRAVELELIVEKSKTEYREYVGRAKSAGNVSKELFQTLQKEEESLYVSKEFKINRLLEEVAKKREAVLYHSSNEIAPLLKSKSLCIFLIHCF